PIVVSEWSSAYVVRGPDDTRSCMEVVLVTGSSGLIGSEVCTYFAEAGYSVHGIDNNQRASFFGPEGDTRWNNPASDAGWRTARHNRIHHLQTACFNQSGIVTPRPGAISTGSVVRTSSLRISVPVESLQR